MPGEAAVQAEQSGKKRLVAGLCVVELFLPGPGPPVRHRGHLLQGLQGRRQAGGRGPQRRVQPGQAGEKLPQRRLQLPGPAHHLPVYN